MSLIHSSWLSQIDRERRSTLNGAVRHDDTTALLDDAEHGREAHPVPCPGLSVVKNGSKMRLCVRRPCRRCVTHVSTTYEPAFSPECRPGCSAAGTPRSRRCSVSIFTRPPCGMASLAIYDEIEDDLLHLPRIGPTLFRFVRPHDRKVDVSPMRLRNIFSRDDTTKSQINDLRLKDLLGD